MKAKDFDKKFDEGKEDILEYFEPSKKLRKHAQEKGYSILEKETKELQDKMRNQFLKHKGYTGSIEICEKKHVFFGKVLFIKDLVSYEGENTEELRESFENAINDYLQTCSNEESPLEKPKL